ncbi:MAG TPA: thiosulfate oxidation carrier protein SoxY [Usitatibacter sp.]|nr:thiosulfate oxidation carrier protein SoxY [Usitatibacter sp.]
MRRRRFLAASGVALASQALPVAAQRFQPAQDVGPLLEKLAGGKRPEPGGMKLEVPQIAENGNSVPLRIAVESPMTATSYVSAIHVVAERNPRPMVATFRLGPHSGRAEISTRIRLAGTQKLRVLAAMSDGHFRLGEVEVLVTSAACLDESL